MFVKIFKTAFPGIDFTDYIYTFAAVFRTESPSIPKRFLGIRRIPEERKTLLRRKQTETDRVHFFSRSHRIAVMAIPI